MTHSLLRRKADGGVARGSRGVTTFPSSDTSRYTYVECSFPGKKVEWPNPVFDPLTFFSSGAASGPT